MKQGGYNGIGMKWPLKYAFVLAMLHLSALFPRSYLLSSICFVDHIFIVWTSLLYGFTQSWY